MTRLLLALAALVLVAPPAAAIAQAAQTNAPPGNSAIDEYLETVPGATGNRSTRPPASGGGGSPSRTLTPAQRAELERLGADGKALAEVVEATSPARPTTTRKRETEPPTPQGRSPLSEALDVATGQDGGGGMGVLLPAILVASLLAAIGLVALRRRSAS